MLHTRALGVDAHVAAVQDHSLDPVWNDRPWDGRVLAEAEVDWVLQAETRTHRRAATGPASAISYHFHSDALEIYYLLDRASWELDGQAVGHHPAAPADGRRPAGDAGRARPSYSTAACIPFPLNPIMTYDVPRWASEQGFDYQYRGRRCADRPVRALRA